MQAVLPSGLITAWFTSSPSGSRERRSRIESKSRVGGGGGFVGFGEFVGFGGLGFEGDDGVRGFSGVENRSRNRSSRNLGARRMRSTRASWPFSVRWRVSKSRNVPSWLQAIAFV